MQVSSDPKIPTDPARVMFLCTGNSCRSQMAEGFTRHLHAGTIDACSAGTDPHGLNPLAVRAMAEAGIDISAHTSKRYDACDPESIDLLVTVCSSADEHCATVPLGRAHVHRGFDDPPKLAQGATSEEDAMRHYRRVRDEIHAFVERLPSLLQSLRQDES